MSKAQNPTRYPAEFKDSAVQLAIESDEPISKTAESLDINVNTLHNWIGKYRACRKPKASPATQEHVYDELKRLRKELKQMKEERDILKKAAAYFAKESL